MPTTVVDRMPALIPEIVAGSAADKAWAWINAHGFDGEHDHRTDDLERAIMDQYNGVMAAKGQTRFKAKIRRDDATARDFMLVFMMHWAASILLKKGVLTNRDAVQMQRDLGVLRQ